MSTSTISSFLKRLTDAAAKSSNAPRHVKSGEDARQGDIYLHAISAKPNSWDRQDVSAHPQLAIGDTMGSRHTVDGTAVQVFWPTDKEKALEELPFGFFEGRGLAAEAKRVLLGPVLVFSSTQVLDHPEHPQFIFDVAPGETRVYLVTYQFDELTRGAVSD